MENKILDILNKYKSYDSNVIYSGNFVNITKEISIEIKLKIAELEAKVYAYEKIIANSNFKAVLKEKKNESN